MSHKVTIDKVEKSLIVNSDIFHLISGQKGYFFEQKKIYTSEIERLKEIIVTTEKERNKFRDDYYFSYNELNLLKVRYDEDIEMIRKKVLLQITIARSTARKSIGIYKLMLIYLA